MADLDSFLAFSVFLDYDGIKDMRIAKKAIRALKKMRRRIEKPTEIIIRIERQRLYLVRGRKVIESYPVSSSRFGLGNESGSNQTPLGRHVICQKIGQGAKLGTIFRSRRNTGCIARIFRHGRTTADQITSRILRLKGLEPGINKGRGIDSLRREIYIHGTPAESLLGRPASNGCIRMANHDIIELFDLVNRGTVVLIRR